MRLSEKRNEPRERTLWSRTTLWKKFSTPPHSPNDTRPSHSPSMGCLLDSNFYPHDLLTPCPYPSAIFELTFQRFSSQQGENHTRQCIQKSHSHHANKSTKLLLC
ncbi:hypothetical protein Plhal304r1_c002g0006571 [Plasmopara halstedii]